VFLQSQTLKYCEISGFPGNDSEEDGSLWSDIL